MQLRWELPAQWFLWFACCSVSSIPTDHLPHLQERPENEESAEQAACCLQEGEEVSADWAGFGTGLEVKAGCVESL